MKPAGKQRLDLLLVERGLAESREKARALVLAGQVLVDGERADKPGHAVPVESRIELLGRLPYVSRAGKKLEAALDAFADRRARAGSAWMWAPPPAASPTACCSAARARVYAVDVGRGQLDWKLRNDPRVVVREGINARYLQPEDIGEPVDLAACDVSFISVTLILPPVGGPAAGARRNGYTGQAPVRSGARPGRQGRHRARSGAARRRPATEWKTPSASWAFAPD